MDETQRVEELEELIRTIRACAGALQRADDDLHQDVGVTATMRAVMDFLRQNGPSTVPDIARARGVSRQNIQVLVDVMITRGVVAARGNPAHKRSSLIALTRSGAQTFRSMRRREQILLAGLADGRSVSSVRSARRALARLSEDLEAVGQDR